MFCSVGETSTKLFPRLFYMLLEDYFHGPFTPQLTAGAQLD